MAEVPDEHSALPDTTTELGENAIHFFCPDFLQAHTGRPPRRDLAQLDVPSNMQNAASQRRFNAPSDVLPADLFTPATCSTPPVCRRVYTDNRGLHTVLIYTDGACSNNGRPDARGGCGIIVQGDAGAEKGISHLLERVPGIPITSNRAELRAVILALGLRAWNGEGFRRVLIGCDSEYVVLGICERVAKWKRRGWRTSSGTPVANQDLWEMLLRKVESMEAKGLSVQFWLIPRALNFQADICAKRATEPEAGEPGIGMGEQGIILMAI